FDNQSAACSVGHGDLGAVESHLDEVADLRRVERLGVRFAGVIQPNVPYHVAAALQALKRVRQTRALQEKQVHAAGIKRNRKDGLGGPLRGSKTDDHRVVLVV